MHAVDGAGPSPVTQETRGKRSYAGTGGQRHCYFGSGQKEQGIRQVMSRDTAMRCDAVTVSQHLGEGMGCSPVRARLHSLPHLGPGPTEEKLH